MNNLSPHRLVSGWLLICLAFTPACNKYVEHPVINSGVLPAITQEGKYTFGCKVNEKLWLPSVDFLFPGYPKSAQFSEKDQHGEGRITCNISSSTKQENMVISFGPTFFQPVTCLGNISNLPKCTAKLQFANGLIYSNDTSDSLNNWVQISAIDTVRNFISGTFQFSLINNQFEQYYVRVTEGRFDLPYDPQ